MSLKNFFVLFLKGMGMGIANVIPGVSGGTIALISGIYEELIHSIKKINYTALKLIFKLNLSEFRKYTNFNFLFAIFLGSVASIFSVANLFKYLFENNPILIWSFFFGLILASIYFVGIKISKWDKKSILSLIIGVFIAHSLSYVPPSTENDNLFFVFICGIIGISGMMLPGLSGSFILILLGNYELLMVDIVSDIFKFQTYEIVLLTVFIAGSVFGLIFFSHLLSWILKNYKNATLALLTGFIAGSLNLIWPWKTISKSVFIDGHEKILRYTPYVPNEINMETLTGGILIILGFLSVYLLERYSFIKK